MPQLMCRVEGIEDPPCHAEDPPNLRLELRADQPTPLAQRTVSWKQGTSTLAEQPTQQSRQPYPPCQAPVSLDPHGLEQYLNKFRSSHNKLKRKVVILEPRQEENLETFQELQLEIDSHDAKFKQIEEFRQNMITEAQALQGLFN